MTPGTEMPLVPGLAEARNYKSVGVALKKIQRGAESVATEGVTVVGGRVFWRTTVVGCGCGSD